MSYTDKIDLKVLKLKETNQIKILKKKQTINRFDKLLLCITSTLRKKIDNNWNMNMYIVYKVYFKLI